jgi:hypothetical protein
MVVKNGGYGNFEWSSDFAEYWNMHLSEFLIDQDTIRHIPHDIQDNVHAARMMMSYGHGVCHRFPSLLDICIAYKNAMQIDLISIISLASRIESLRYSLCNLDDRLRIDQEYTQNTYNFSSYMTSQNNRPGDFILTNRDAPLYIYTRESLQKYLTTLDYTTLKCDLQDELTRMESSREWMALPNYVQNALIGFHNLHHASSHIDEEPRAPSPVYQFVNAILKHGHDSEFIWNHQSSFDTRSMCFLAFCNINIPNAFQYFKNLNRDIALPPLYEEIGLMCASPLHAKLTLHHPHITRLMQATACPLSPPRHEVR